MSLKSYIIKHGIKNMLHRSSKTINNFSLFDENNIIDKFLDEKNIIDKFLLDVMYVQEGFIDIHTLEFIDDAIELICCDELEEEDQIDWVVAINNMIEPRVIYVGTIRSWLNPRRFEIAQEIATSECCTDLTQVFSNAYLADQISTMTRFINYLLSHQND